MKCNEKTYSELRLERSEKLKRTRDLDSFIQTTIFLISIGALLILIS